MFLISFLPDWVFHALFLLGLLALGGSFLLRFIPPVAPYKIPIQVAAGLVIIFSVYMEGGISNEEKWQARVHELEAKVAESEKQSAIANGQIDNKANKKIQVVKEVQYIVQDRLRTESVNIDSQCKVAPSIIELLNTTALGQIKGDKK